MCLVTGGECAEVTGLSERWDITKIDILIAYNE